jgi:hypothetical protein
MSWFQNAHYGHRDEKLHHEALGMGILFDDAGHLADKLIAPLEDGSVCIWNASNSSERQGSIVGRSAIGMLANKRSDLDLDTRISQSKSIMTETGAVECVSIDSRQKKGFFAVQNVLNEVDLYTLQIVSRTPFPFPITALSEARHPTPLTVGTNWTLHLHDTRKPPSILDSSPGSSTKCELIAGNPSPSFLRLQTGDFGGHVSLSQPGPLSILHLPTTRDWDGNGEIWVGGRFTSFLNYDRRFFPRLRGTVHSGARLSCMTALPYPFIPPELRRHGPNLTSAAVREAKAIPGHTLLAAGEYKGKGSLELYSLSSDPIRSINSSDMRSRNHASYYHNRQTASSSKLLSVAAHGTRIVFSDGDGNLKWVERDGSTPVRQLNINGHDAASPADGGGDIVQKILPTVARGNAESGEVPLGEDNLVVWTGDGKVGMVGFGRGPVFQVEDLEEGAQTAEEVALMDREREYGTELRRALERQAAELRWMRGYGLR